MSVVKYSFIVFLMCVSGFICIGCIASIVILGLALMTTTNSAHPLPIVTLMLVFGGAAMLFADITEGLQKQLSRKELACSRSTKSS